MDLPGVLGVALRIAAAQPPSAITVWALPNNDFVTTATRRPRSGRLDHRAQSRPAGADHDDVVLVPFQFRHLNPSTSLVVNCASQSAAVSQ